MSSAENRYTSQAIRLFLLAPRIRKVNAIIYYNLYDSILTILNNLWNLPVRNTQIYRLFSIGSGFHEQMEMFGLEHLDISRPMWYMDRTDQNYDLPTLNWLLTSMTFDKYCDAEIVAYYVRLHPDSPTLAELFRYFAIHGEVPPSLQMMTVEIIEPNSWADMIPNVHMHRTYEPNVILRHRYS
ncbi:hypothetical protein H0H93_011520 [Arthromyces matolae]|nr:hypothetical protein H0H93_011520 [Arthromyces matolae]